VAEGGERGTAADDDPTAPNRETDSTLHELSSLLVLDSQSITGEQVYQSFSP
jgi:hypothetical protein